MTDVVTFSNVCDGDMVPSAIGNERKRGLIGGEREEAFGLDGLRIKNRKASEGSSEATLAAKHRFGP